MNHQGGWQLVCVCRVVQGLTQAFIYPCMHHLVSQWIPLEEKGLLTTIVYAGTKIINITFARPSPDPTLKFYPDKNYFLKFKFIYSEQTTNMDTFSQHYLASSWKQSWYYGTQMLIVYLLKVAL